MTRDNNFDLLRLMASLGVFYMHGCYLFDKSIIAFFNNTNSIGSIAVFVFFFISGYLIFQSLNRTENRIDFIVKRICRIFPGLIVAAFFSVFVVGLWMTKMDKFIFLNDQKTWGLFFNYMFALANQHQLPGVFEMNPFAWAVNGSLWTLKYELLMYAILFVLALVVGKINLIQSVLVVLGFFILFLFSGDIVFLQGIFTLKDFSMFGVLFFLGVIFCFFNLKNKNFLLIAIFLGFIIANFSTSFRILSLGVFILVSSGVLFVAYFKPLTKIKLKHDLSYGIYIYAFPVQQALTEISLSQGWSKWMCLTLSLLIIVPLAWLSWNYVEKPGIALGKRIGQKFYKKQSAPAAL